jgi:hypothetical protein
MANISTKYIEPGKAYNNLDMRIPDLRHGSQFGYSPDPKAILSNTPEVRRDLVVHVTRFPGAFDLIPDGDLWRRTLQSLIETKPKSVTGFDATVTLETGNSEVDRTGNAIKPITGGSIQHTELQVTYSHDYVGSPIVRFWSEFLRMFAYDVNTGMPGISTMDVELPDDWTLDMYTFDIIAYEPNIHFRKVLRSWEVYGCHNTASGTIQGGNDPLGGKSVEELSYTFTGVDVFNDGTIKAAQAILDKADLKGANPYSQKSGLTDEQISRITEGGNGYFSTIDRVRDNQIDK